MLSKVIEMLEQRATGTCRVLDYGSGPNPVLVELLQRRGYRAVGYDPLFAPDTDLSEPFDAILAVEVFEHFAAPAREIKRITSLLRPGGRLIIHTLLHRGPNSFGDWWYARDLTHVTFYSLRTMRWIADKFRFHRFDSDGERLVKLDRRAGNPIPPAAPRD